jgi:hypothetical protein
MGFGVLIEHEIFARTGLMKTLLYTLEEKLDWRMKKNLSIQGYHQLIMCPTRHMINWGHTKWKKTYENFYSVFGYNLAKQKKKSVCKNAGI